MIIIDNYLSEKSVKQTNKYNFKIKTLFNKKVRHLEYYPNIKDIQQDLYKRSSENKNFYNLYPKVISKENILLAIRNIKANKGKDTKGVNNTLMQDILNEDVESIQNWMKLKLENYKPLPIRRIYIPKPNSIKKRPLGLPSMEDRLIQQCILQILEPICEAHFHKYSYGFRPFRSTHHAMARVSNILTRTNAKYCVNVDLKSFFDEVNHSKLIKQMYTLGIKDKKILSITKAILKSEISDKGVITRSNKGTPQGGIISPLLSNIVLNELDWWLATQYGEDFVTRNTFARGCEKNYALQRTRVKELYYVRYADDVRIFTTSRNNANKILIALKQWLKERLRLEVNDDKTQIINLRNKNMEFLGFSTKLIRNNKYKTYKRTANSMKFIPNTKMSPKAIENLKSKLKESIKGIKNSFWQVDRIKAIYKYNSIVSGYINYFQFSNSYPILNKIEGSIIRIIKYNRLRRIYKINMKIKGPKSNLDNNNQRYQFTKNRKNSMVVNGIKLRELSDFKYHTPKQFNPKICKYTDEGLKLVHKDLDLNKTIIKRLSKNPIPFRSAEFNDNRISVYTAQRGKCYVTGIPLAYGNMDLHHIIKLEDNGTNKFSNLVYLNTKIHEVIHMKNVDKIYERLNDMIPQITEISIEKFFKRLNYLRESVGNPRLEILI